MRLSSGAVLRVAVVLIVLSAALPGQAGASGIDIQSQSFSGTTVPIGVSPFDPTLGTLDSVNVTISGVLSVSGLAPALPSGVPGQFLPYFYRVFVGQDFSGLGGSYFDFQQPADFSFNGSTSGTGENFTLTRAFSYSFTFTSTTDLVGFAFFSSTGPNSPPPSVNGLRSDFVESLASPNQILLTHTATGMALNGLVPIPMNWNSEGALTIQYNYTPVPVPEPAAFALLAVGIGVLGAGRLRRRIGR